MKANIQNSFGIWLQSHNWTHWVTCTTPYALTLNSSRRLMERFGTMRINTTITAPKVLKSMFWASESFDCREGYHTHALIEIDENMPFKAVINAYQISTGNKDLQKGKKWARIQLSRYNPKRHAAFYVAKYISKKLADYDLIN